MKKQIVESSELDSLGAQLGAYYHTLREISDSAGAASQMLHSKTRLSGKDRLELLAQMETCQALSMVLLSEYPEMISEMVGIAAARATDKVSETITRRTLRDCIELTPYLVHLRAH